MEFEGHVDELLLGQLECGDRPAELLAADVQRAVHDPAERLTGVRLALQDQFDTGQFGADRPGEHGQCGVAAGAGEADGDPAHLAEVGGLHGAAYGGRLGEQMPGRSEQRLPGGGEPDRAGRPVEELHTQVPLEQPDLLAQRRLGDVRAFGGAAEVQFLGDGDESGEMT